MVHWLEEAEIKISHHNKKKTAIKGRIEFKKDEVQDNRLLIEEDYLQIIHEFNHLIERINSLPRQMRTPFGQIHSKQKENKLNNLLYKFHSSRRITHKEFRSIIKPWKAQQYKNTRAFFVSIGREKNHLIIEYKEVKAKRTRIYNENRSIWNRVFGKKQQKSKDASRVIDDIKNLHINHINNAFIMDHIDWLAFKKDKLPFKENK